MGKWTRRILIALAVLIALAGGAYYWLIVQSGTAPAPFALDLGEVRRLADSLAGDKASAVRVERIEQGSFPATAVVAGDGWSQTAMVMFSYELVFAAGPVIIDTGMPKGDSKKGGMIFDDAAFARMSKALNEASAIVVTHEHNDHLGGLLAQPNVKALLARARLNRQQVDNAAAWNPGMPANLFAGYTPVAYDKYFAIAPGVVLIRAAGHTPGSQMVYVKTASGEEFLFTGDVAWHMRNIDLVRERARLVTAFMLHEDRDVVLSQLAALNALKKAEPSLHIVAGHDPEPVAVLEQAGLIAKGFR